MTSLSQIKTDSNWGLEAPKLNQNFQNISTDILKLKNSTIRFKGYHTSEEGLKSKYPAPQSGDYAWVGTPYPGKVYDVVEGQWNNTNEAPPAESVDLANYYTSEEVDAIKSEQDGRISTIEEVQTSQSEEIKQLGEEVKKGSSGNLILTWNTDVATTRKSVPSDKRKEGLQISYKENNKEWKNEQYIGNAFDDSSWANNANWKSIASDIEVDKELNEESEKPVANSPVTKGINEVKQLLSTQLPAIEQAKEDAIHEIGNKENEAIQNFSEQKVTPTMLSPETVQLINASGGGTITNLPDGETLAEVEMAEGTKAIGIPDRAADTNMGYVILKKNKSLIEQVTKANTIYEVRYSYDLSGETLEMPDNCTLKFFGGRIYNGTIQGNNTDISASKEKIFENITVEGDYNIAYSLPEWFGAVAFSTKYNNQYDSVDEYVYLNAEDASVAINNALLLSQKSGCPCLLSSGIYLIKNTVEVPANVELQLSSNSIIATAMKGTGEYIYVQDKESLVPQKVSITSESRVCNDFVSGQPFNYPVYLKENEFIATESMAIAVKLKGKGASVTGRGMLNLKFQTQFTVGIYVESWGYNWNDMSYSPTVDIRIIDGEFNTCIGDSTQHYSTSIPTGSVGVDGDFCWNLKNNNLWTTGALYKKVNGNWEKQSGSYYVGSFNTHVRLECPNSEYRITNLNMNVWSASGFRGVEFILLEESAGWINSSFWKGTFSYKWGGCFSYFGRGAFEDHDLSNVNVQMTNIPYCENFRIIYGSPQHNKFGTFWDIDFTTHKSNIMAEMLKNSNFNEITSIISPKYIQDSGSYNNWGNSYLKGDMYYKNIYSGLTEYTLSKDYISRFSDVVNLTISLPQNRGGEEYNFIISTSKISNKININFSEEIEWNVNFSFVKNNTYYGSIIGNKGIISGKPSDFRNDIIDKCNEYYSFSDAEVNKILASSTLGDGVGVMKDVFVNAKGDEFTFKSNKSVVSFSELEKCIQMTSTKGSDVYLGMFYGCSALQSVKFPDSITTIFNGTFKDCSNLNSLKINQSNIVDIQTQAFYGCKKLLLEINLPNLQQIGKGAFSTSGVTSIISLGQITDLQGELNYNNGCFYGCANLTTVSLPESLISIGPGSFQKCTSLASINIPQSIETIGDKAFNETDLTALEVNLPNLKTIGAAAFAKSNITKVVNLGNIQELKGIASYLQGTFAQCTKLTDVTLPATLAKLGQAEFTKCTSLVNINLPESLEEIGDNCFADCTKLNVEINLPNLNILGNSAFSSTGITKVINLGNVTKDPSTQAWVGFFWNCVSLESAVLPETFIESKGGTFSGCKALKTVVVKALTPPSITNAFLYNANLLENIYVPDSSVEAYKSAEIWSGYADKIHPMSEYVE